jgi:hypothetical protein
MKRFLVSSLSVLLLSVAVAPGVKAETFQANPFQLVSLATQGYLQEYGIPKYSALVDAYSEGQITARDVIQAAINDNRVSADKLNDESYLSAVDNFLNNLTTQGASR